jgi:protein subunit release factor A
MITRNPAAFRSSITSFTQGYWPASFHRSFSSGDDDDDGATTDLASALETFWSPAVQLQLQSAAAALPSVQDSLSSLTPGGQEYVKQMRRVETLATLERMLQQLTALQADSLGMEALAQEAAASGDAAMGEEAQAACKKLAEDAKGIKLELLKFLVPSDDADSMDAILELRAGVGGGEASLWCADMCSMYQRFCEQKGWDFEIVSSAGTESGGMREVRGARARDHAGVTLRAQVVCTVSGSGAFGMLRFESGVHRVQRVSCCSPMHAVSCDMCACYRCLKQRRWGACTRRPPRSR